MNKHAPYEHEHVEDFDKLANIEIYVDIEENLQQFKHKNLLRI
jgi:hypothetical protein